MSALRVPLKAVDAAVLRSGDRAHAFLVLCSRVAVAAGTHPAPCRSVPSTLCSLKRGQVVTSVGELAHWWGATKSSAQKTIAAFEKAGLVQLSPGADAGLRGLPAPDGSLVTVLGL